MAHAPAAPQMLPGDPVTLVLKSGQAITGAIERFLPESPDVKLRSQERGRERLPTTEIAYIAFHRRPSDRPLSLVGLEAYKLRLSNGQTVRVLMRPAAGPADPAQSRLGFRALPIPPEQNDDAA